MIAPLAPLERWLVQAVSTLEPAPRRALLRKIVVELRRRTQARLGRQTGPDGKAWAPRKRDRQGRVRKTVRMMEELRKNRHLLVQARADSAELGWTGMAGRISLTHQDGDVDEVVKGGPRVKYPARPLLGLTTDEIAYVRETLLAALST